MLFEREVSRDSLATESIQACLPDQYSQLHSCQSIKTEQLRLVKSRAYSDFIGLLFCSTAMSMILWSQANHKIIIVWMSSVVLAGLVHAIASREYPFDRPESQTDSEDHCTWPLCASSVLVGTSWNAVTVLLGSVDPAQLAALVILQVGYLVFGTILRASVPSILTAFIASALLSSGFVAFFINNQPVTQTLLPLLITGVGLTALGYISHRSLQAQFALRLKADQRASIYAMERDSANQEILAKNQFLSAASHDLKQPVHAIGLFAGLLEMKLNTPDTKGLLGKIQCSTDALSSDISRLDAKAMEHDPQHIVLDPLLNRLENEYELQAREKGLSLTFDCQSGLIAYVDSGLLERVLMNLVSNAIKFTDTGSIVVSIRPEHERLSLLISDTGRGIAPDQIEKIFIEYQQIRNPEAAPSGGHGLGLAIVKRLCQLMEVDIKLTSTPGIGTQFHLSIDAGCASKLEALEPLNTTAFPQPNTHANMVSEVA